MQSVVLYLKATTSCWDCILLAWNLLPQLILSVAIVMGYNLYYSIVSISSQKICLPYIEGFSSATHPDQVTELP